MHQNTTLAMRNCCAKRRMHGAVKESANVTSVDVCETAKQQVCGPGRSLSNHITKDTNNA